MNPPTIKWDEICKIRIANSDPSFEKHEVIKILLVMKLQEKYKHQKNYIRIYTESPITINKKVKRCDVYFENIKTKEVYIYEIQKDFSKRWLAQITNFYKDLDKQLSMMFFKTTDLIPIKLNNLSDNIKELSKQIEELIV